MKRLLFVAVTLLCAVAVYASTAFTINPSEMKSGESKKLVDGDRTVTVTRNGDAVDIRIDGGAAAEKLTITRGHQGYRIERDGAQTWVVPGAGLEGLQGLEGLRVPAVRSFKFNNASKQTWFVCPKDHTMMRVPEGNTDQTFKCPVDGTAMEKRKGAGFAFFFDDDFQPENL
jgi:hypothetical protein